MKLKKYANNPILSPNPKNQWEELVTCNPAAWYEDGTFYMLYRAAGNDPEHYIYLGLAKSKDGYNFERCFDHPVVKPQSLLLSFSELLQDMHLLSLPFVVLATSKAPLLWHKLCH